MTDCLPSSEQSKTCNLGFVHQPATILSTLCLLSLASRTPRLMSEGHEATKASAFQERKWSEGRVLG